MYNRFREPNIRNNLEDNRQNHFKKDHFLNRNHRKYDIPMKIYEKKNFDKNISINKNSRPNSYDSKKYDNNCKNANQLYFNDNNNFLRGSKTYYSQKSPSIYNKNDINNINNKLRNDEKRYYSHYGSFYNERDSKGYDRENNFNNYNNKKSNNNEYNQYNRNNINKEKQNENNYSNIKQIKNENYNKHINNVNYQYLKEYDHTNNIKNSSSINYFNNKNKESVSSKKEYYTQIQLKGFYDYENEMEKNYIGRKRSNTFYYDIDKYNDNSIKTKNVLNYLNNNNNYHPDFNDNKYNFEENMPYNNINSKNKTLNKENYNNKPFINNFVNTNFKQNNYNNNHLNIIQNNKNNYNYKKNSLNKNNYNNFHNNHFINNENNIQKNKNSSNKNSFKENNNNNFNNNSMNNNFHNINNFNNFNNNNEFQNLQNNFNNQMIMNNNFININQNNLKSQQHFNNIFIGINNNNSNWNNNIRMNVFNNNNANLVQNINKNHKRNNSTPHIKHNYIPIINNHANGLENVGATCYMNATLQCLAHIENLTKYFLRTEVISQITSNSYKYKLSQAYLRVIRSLWTNNNLNYYSPKDFKNVISGMNSLFAGVQANDSKDLVLFLVETMHNELNKAKNTKPSNQNINQYNYEQTFQSFFQYFANNYNSVISNLFYGMYNSMMTCYSCKITTNNVQCYNILIFPLEEIRKFKNRYNNMVDIIECFEYYEKYDYMVGQNQIYCNNCKRMANSINKSKLIIGPNVLVINLNRGKGLQFNVKLSFGEYLNLRNFIYYKQSPYYYELIGIVTHFGPSNMGGLFIAFCKSFVDQQWYKYNDAIVTSSSFQEASSIGVPYILFYSYVKC